MFPIASTRMFGLNTPKALPSSSSTVCQAAHQHTYFVVPPLLNENQDSHVKCAQAKCSSGLRRNLTCDGMGMARGLSERMCLSTSLTMKVECM